MRNSCGQFYVHVCNQGNLVFLVWTAHSFTDTHSGEKMFSKISFTPEQLRYVICIEPQFSIEYWSPTYISFEKIQPNTVSYGWMIRKKNWIWKTSCKKSSSTDDDGRSGGLRGNKFRKLAQNAAMKCCAFSEMRFSQG